MALTAYEADMAAQKRRNQQFNDMAIAARQRRLDSQDVAALSDPGRYAPQVYRDAKERFDQRGLRTHELAMAQKDSDTKLGVAEKNAFGMQHQGEFAAQHNADAAMYRADMDVDIADITQKGLTDREKAIAAGNLEVEKTRQAGAKSVAETQGAATVGAAKATAEANASIAAAKRSTDTSIADARNKTAIESARIRNDAVAQRRAVNLRDQVLQGKRQDMPYGKWKNMTKDEQDAWIASQMQ